MKLLTIATDLSNLNPLTIRLKEAGIDAIVSSDPIAVGAVIVSENPISS
jgi:hypothetical protein